MLIDQTGEEGDAFFRLGCREPGKVNAAGVQASSGPHRSDFEKISLVKPKKDVDILLRRPIIAAMIAVLVFQKIFAAASIFSVGRVRPIETVGQVQARQSGNLVSQPESIVRVTHSINGGSQILTDRLDSEPPIC